MNFIPDNRKPLILEWKNDRENGTIEDNITSACRTLKCGRLRCLRVASGTTPLLGRYIRSPVGAADPGCLRPVSKLFWAGVGVLREEFVETLYEGAATGGWKLTFGPLTPCIGGLGWWWLWCRWLMGGGCWKLGGLRLLAVSWYLCTPMLRASTPLTLLPVRNITERYI